MEETGKDRSAAGSDSVLARIREELQGRCFSTAKELRHIVESCGFSFVPVEAVSADDYRAHMVLNPRGSGVIHVFAERSRHWHPFYIRRIEPAAAA